jgi:O-antigen/teichoic acid export membrane protein
MNRVNRNIVANFASAVWASVLSLAFIPLYVHLMGVEAYGLVGLLPTLQALFVPLDLGLSTTLNRELAVASSDIASKRAAIHMVRTIEIVYWAAAIVFGLIVALGAPWLATQWVKPAALSTLTVTHAFILIGIALMFQLPASLYSGGLLGLQEQVRLNIINVVAATVRGVGAIAVLYLVGRSVIVFFAWQAIITAIQTVVTAFALWGSLAGSAGAEFRRAELKRVGNFTMSMVAISMLSVLMMQLDKIILSKVLPLEQFGYYALAASVAAVMYRGFSPVYQAVFPRLSQLASANDMSAIRTVYHEAAQLVSVLVIPAAVVLSLFAREALTLWLRDPVTASRSAAILTVLVIGTAMYSAYHIPYALQLAFGWTSLPLRTNIAAVVVLAPAMFIAARLYGGIGAASVWVALNVVYLTVPVQIMHRRLIPGAQWRWYGDDLGRPLLAALAVALAGKFLLFAAPPAFPRIVILGVTAVGSLTAAAMSVPVTSRWLRILTDRLRAREA